MSGKREAPLLRTPDLDDAPEERENREDWRQSQRG